ncbi:MAG: hypothetical protein IPL93_11390 [Actinomycetales bacterium]|nr:hypothetical protein [Actinomycetales bacterium]
MSGFGADPLARLRLDKTMVKIKGIDQTDVRAVVGRSSIPPPSPAAPCRGGSLAIRQLADRAAEGMPVRWANAVADTADPGAAGLSDPLDQAVIRSRRCGLDSRSGGESTDVVQWIFGSVTLTGFLWLTALLVVGWLQLPDLPTPTISQLAVPFLLLTGGISAVCLPRPSIGCSSGGISTAGQGGRPQLHDTIAEVADSRIVAPSWPSSSGIGSCARPSTGPVTRADSGCRQAGGRCPQPCTRVPPSTNRAVASPSWPPGFPARCRYAGPPEDRIETGDPR